MLLLWCCVRRPGKALKHLHTIQSKVEGGPAGRGWPAGASPQSSSSPCILAFIASPPTHLLLLAARRGYGSLAEVWEKTEEGVLFSRRRENLGPEILGPGFSISGSQLASSAGHASHRQTVATQ